MKKVLLLFAVISLNITLNAQGLTEDDPISLSQGVNTILQTQEFMYYSYTPTQECFVEISTCGLNSNEQRIFYNIISPITYRNSSTYWDINCNERYGKTVVFKAEAGVEIVLEHRNQTLSAGSGINIVETPIEQGDLEDDPLNASASFQVEFTSIPEQWYTYIAERDGYIRIDTSSVHGSRLERVRYCEAGESFSIKLEGQRGSNYTCTITNNTFSPGETCGDPIPLRTNTPFTVHHSLREQYYSITPQRDMAIRINYCNLPNRPHSAYITSPCSSTLEPDSHDCSQYLPLYKGQTYNLEFRSEIDNEYEVVMEEVPFFSGFDCTTSIEAHQGMNIIPSDYIQWDIWYSYTMQAEGTFEIDMVNSNNFNNIIIYDNNYSCVDYNYADYNVSRTLRVGETVKIYFSRISPTDTFYIQERPADRGEFIDNAISATANSIITANFNNTSLLYFSYRASETGVLEFSIPDNVQVGIAAQTGNSVEDIIPLSDNSFIVSADTEYYLWISSEDNTINWSFIERNVNSDLCNFFRRAIYDPLNNEGLYGYNHTVIADFPSDDSETPINDNRDLDEFMLFNYSECNTNLYSYWQANWYGINNCNLTIDTLANLNIRYEDQDANILLGEAHVLRALYYYNLLNAFGDLPIIFDPFYTIINPERFSSRYLTNYPRPFINAERVSQNVVWRQIEDDLLIGITLLPLKSEYEIENNWRVSKGSAQAMLTKSYIYQEKWSEAFAMAKNVINSNEYALVENYKDIFSYYDENNEEVILTVNCVTSQDYEGTGSRNPMEQSFRYVRNANGEVDEHFINYGSHCPTQNYIDEFEAGDTRFELVGEDGDSVYITNREPMEDGWYYFDMSMTPTVYYNRKYEMPTEVEELNNFNSGLDIILFRYADLLLLAAESAFHLEKEDTARMYINQVRERARGGNDVLPNITASGDELLIALKHERRMELGLEGQRFFDLRRWGDLAEVYQNLTELQGEPINFLEGRNEYFPVPCQYVSSYFATLEQNPGYESYQMIKVHEIGYADTVYVDAADFPLVYDVSDVFSIVGIDDAEIDLNGWANIYENGVAIGSIYHPNHAFSSFLIDEELYIYSDDDFVGEFDVILQGYYWLGASACDTLHVVVGRNERVTIEEPKQSEVYPNPLKNMLNVKSSNEMQSVYVVDINGKLIERVNAVNSQYIEINTLQYTSGIYFVVVKDKTESTEIHKVVKE